MKLLMCFVTPLPALPVRFTAQTRDQGRLMRHRITRGGNSHRMGLDLSNWMGECVGLLPAPVSPLPMSPAVPITPVARPDPTAPTPDPTRPTPLPTRPTPALQQEVRGEGG